MADEEKFNSTVTADPIVVSFGPSDEDDPQSMPNWRKRAAVTMTCLATFVNAFSTSVFTGSIDGVAAEFDASREVATLGISLFVLGLAIGPLLWAPLSEAYGRKPLFIATFGCSVAFSAAAAASPNVTSLLIFRLLAGSFGASSLPTCGGVISDVFTPQQRGPASSALAIATFTGPVFGPIIGGFMGETAGWRWISAFVAILAGTVFLSALPLLPETYPPLLLRRKAARLTTKTSTLHVSALDYAIATAQSQSERFKTALSRPFILLFHEPTVLALSIYIALVYGILFTLFAAFPLVFQHARGWSPGLSGLAFLGMAIGMALALPANHLFERRRKSLPDSNPPPEIRLEPTLPASVLLPVGLILFAWLNDPSIPWIGCIIASAPVGFSMVLIFLSITNYLIDSYLIYSASVLAATSVLRSLFGAVFPLFTQRIYDALGIHWASSVPAFLAFLFMPAPWVFYKWGARVRERCPYAARAVVEAKLMVSEPSSPVSAVGRGGEV